MSSTEVEKVESTTTLVPGFTFKDLLTKVDRELHQEEVEKGKKNKTQRLAEWQAPIDEMDIEKVVALQEAMTSFVDDVFAKVDDANPRKLTDGEKKLLAAEYLEVTKIMEALEARKWRIRGMVFRHLNTEYFENGVEEPANTSGEIRVPEYGINFKREGCGRKDPEFNLAMLKEKLGEEWSRVVDVRQLPAYVVEAHEVEDFNEKKLMDLLAEKPEVLEVVRECLTPGKVKSAKFQVRKI